MGGMSFATVVENPGDFFACMGVLYCADRFFDNSKGHFKAGRFHLEADCDGNMLSEIVQKVNSAMAASPMKLDDPDDKATPITLRGIGLRLDFWKHFDDRPTIKLFAGQQTSSGEVGRWLGHLEKFTGAGDLREFSVTDLASGLDVTTSWNALDVGFSLNEHKIKTKVYPLVEFFAYVGVQAYGWRRGSSSYYYNVWHVPLPMRIARAVAAGALEMPGMTTLVEFEAKKSGQKQILKTGREVRYEEYGPGRDGE